MINKKNLTSKGMACLSMAIFLMTSCQKEIIIPTAKKENNLEKLATTVNLNNAAIPQNPYYEVDSLGKATQIFQEYPSAATEKERLFLSFLPSDFLPTGFYAKTGDTIRMNVQKTAGMALPKLLIGTYRRYGLSFTPQEVQLQEGANTIIAAKRGLLWIRYGSTATPSSSATITFTQIPKIAPTYVKNKTVQATFQNAITTSDSTIHDILFVGQNTFTVMPKATAPFQTQNNNLVIQQLDLAWDAHERLSGLDGSTPLHSPYQVPHTLSICEPAFAGAVAGNYATGYSYNSNFYVNDSYTYWFQRHEFGHMHQQRWDWHAEILGDFYAVSAGINQGLATNKIARDGAWSTIWTRVKEYVNKPEAEKDYSVIWGDGGVQGSRYLGSAMMIQLKYVFGDSLFHQLHKLVRQEKPSLGTAALKHQYFMQKTCIISGYDLSDFFKKWGFNYPTAYTTIAALNLPKPIVDPSLFTDTERPILENGAVYQIVSALNNSSVIESNSSTPTNGSTISLWTNSGSTKQQFLARKLSDGTFAFKSMADTTKIIAVKGASSVAGTFIHMYTFDNGLAQRWMPEKLSNGYYTLKSSIAANRFLDVVAGLTADGTKVQIWTTSSGTEQKFKFLRK